MFPGVLKEEHMMIQKLAADFANKEVAPQAYDNDEQGRFPAENVKKMGELGFMGVAIPEAYGGAGMDTVAYIMAMEEINRVCASTGVIMSVNNSLVCDPIYKFGSEEQKKKYLTPLAQGKKLGCFCLSEPQAGSDAANQRTTAKKSGEEYIIQGTKNFITNGKEADVAIVFATTDKSKGHKGVSAFIVETDSPGFVITKIEHKLGIKASSTAQIAFDDCCVPQENLLGAPGDGFKIAMSTLDGGRIGIAAQAVGITRGALEASVRYANEREAFGQKISQYQAIQWKIADIATELEAARLLVHQAAVMKDQKILYTQKAAMAKLFASEVAMRATTQAIQIFGGYGYIKEYHVERYFRDAKITEIYEGTSEIQRLIIAQNVLKN